ncbi:hypothetical protein QFZ91_005541 [Paraburkholderia sp. JPY419]
MHLTLLGIASLWTNSPGKRTRCVRKGAGRPVYVKEGKADRLSGRILDSPSSGCVVAQVSAVNPGQTALTLIPVPSSSMAYRIECCFRGLIDTDILPRVIRRAVLEREGTTCARNVDYASYRRFSKERQHRLRNGDNPKHVRLEDQADIVNGCAAHLIPVSHFIGRSPSILDLPGSRNNRGLIGYVESDRLAVTSKTSCCCHTKAEFVTGAGRGSRARPASSSRTLVPQRE